MNTRMHEDRSIFQIEVDRIDPHPLNPRKNLGDLTELMASIKKSGIMQNLTVVPQNDEMTRFTVVIGHRRLAAAKRLKLAAVPCVIAHDMDEKEQVATMIAENMQRNDLTVAEQAGAVQLMLDFGEDFESIAERTGLSESTVRRRAKIARYDADKLTKAIKRGATLLDIEKIAEINDESKREELLTAAGTNNFNYLMKKYSNEQKDAEVLPEITGKLEELGFRPFSEIPTGKTPYYINGIYNIGNVNNTYILNENGRWRAGQPEDAEFYYKATINQYGGRVKIYCTSEQREQKDERDAEKRRKLDERRRLIESLDERFYDIRHRHIIDVFLKGQRRVKFDNSCLQSIALDFLYGGISWNIREDFDEYEKNEKTAEIQIYLLCAMQLNKNTCPMDYYSGKFNHRSELSDLFRLLEEDGYQISDEERAFYNGTHEVWKDGDDA